MLKSKLSCVWCRCVCVCEMRKQNGVKDLKTLYVGWSIVTRLATAAATVAAAVAVADAVAIAVDGSHVDDSSHTHCQFNIVVTLYRTTCSILYQHIDRTRVNARKLQNFAI